MAELSTLHSDHKALQEQLADVQARFDAKKGDYTAACDALLQKWEEDNAELLAERDHIIEKAGSVEAELRNAIKETYAADPSKKTVAPGLSVRVTKHPLYDVEKAFQWALSHKLALKLDNKTFEKIADSASDVDFVTYDETVTAVIGK